MEAVPRLPMLAFELKHSPEYVDFGPTLKKYIRDHYGEDPALYNKNFSDLDQLRQNAIHVTRDFVGCATLKRYYSQLNLMNGRFPMGEGGESAITFTWEDNQTGRDHIIADIKFEQACILYNIGALHSNLGAIDTRQNAEGMKVSCTHFQCAAWAFEHLRDHFGSSSMSTDMAHEFLTFHVNVMLAQAQECILEKSMIDSRKNTITAKVSAQVVDFYRLSVKNLDQCNAEQIINSRSYKDWKKRIELKIAFYQCITHYYMGKQSEDQQKWGERLAYYQASQEKLNESVKLAKNEVPEMQEALRFAQDVVGGKLQSAQKDNDFIYHEKIPPLDSLPEVKGAPLVKGIPFDPTDPEISGADIFQKLVPMEAHEASSVYSEEKAKLLRAVVEDIETANTELEQFMSSLQIDASMFEQVPDRLPQDLLEKCAAMSVRTNAIKDLVDSMSAVSGLATETEMNIKETQDMIAEDAQKTEEFEKQFGKKMVSSVLPGLATDCEGHGEKHSQGSQLNASLHTAMNAHIASLKMLALPPEQLQAQLPPAQPPRSAEDEEVMTEMRRLLSKIDEMKTQRAALEKQFRDDIQKDDITSVLMAVDSTKESIYKDQLKKHDTLIGYIGQNLNAQMNILRALTDANARFASLRQAISQQSNQRESFIQNLISTFDKYEELLAKSKKGQDYYNRLNEAVNRTLERCRSECKVRQEERDMIASKYAPKVPPPSRPTAPKPGQGGQPGTPGTPAPSSAAMPPMDPSQMVPGVMPTVTGGSAALPTFEGPKLKDFLPFMKPQSFGSKRSSPSPQSLPPGSPDPMLSGPPSLASSASDSPQHRLSAQMPPGVALDQIPTAGQQGALGPDVTDTKPLPSARSSSVDRHPYPAPPPDVTANLPVNPALQMSQGSLPDVSSLPAASDGFSSLPHSIGSHTQFRGYGGGMPLGIKGGNEDVSGLSSSSDSLASAGSYQRGYRQPGAQGQLPTSMAAGVDMTQNTVAAVPQSGLASMPESSLASMPQTSLPQHILTQQYQQPHLPGPAAQPHSHVPGGQGQGQYPMPHGVPGQQGMIRPSPSPSPSLSPAPSPAPSPSISMHQQGMPGYQLPQQGVAGYQKVQQGTVSQPQTQQGLTGPQQPQQGVPGLQQGVHSQGGYSLPPHLAQSAALRPATPPQPAHLTQPQFLQQPQMYQQQQQVHSQGFPGGTVPGQGPGPSGQSFQQAQPGLAAGSRPQGAGLQAPGQAYSQQVPAPGGIRPPGPSQTPQHVYSQFPSSGSPAAALPGSSLLPQHYSVPSNVPAQNSAASPAMGQAQVSVGQAANPAQGMFAGNHSMATSQPSGAQYQSQQSMSMQAQASLQPARPPQEQVPHAHSQSGVQPSQPVFQQGSQGLPQFQGQGHGQPGQFMPGAQGQRNMAGVGVSLVPSMMSSGVATQGGYQPSPGVSSAMSQTSLPTASTSSLHQYNQQPGLQHQQQFHPATQQPPMQHAQPSNSYQPGFNPGQQVPRHAVPGHVPPAMTGQQVPRQTVPGSVPPAMTGQQVPRQTVPGQVPPAMTGQPQGQGQPQGLVQGQGQSALTRQGQFGPGQQGYSTAAKLQQFPPQQQQIPQQQFQQQHSFPQQQPNQQQFPQQQQSYPQQQSQQQPSLQLPQQQMGPQSQQMMGQQVRPQGQQPMTGQHPLSPLQPQLQQQPQQQKQTFTQYSGQPRIPSESPLIFPTPLQPSRAQSNDTLQPQPPTPNQGGTSSAPSLPTNSHHSLPPDLHSSSSAPAVQQIQSPTSPTPPQPGISPSTPSQPALARQESSLDELLSSSPEGSKHASIPAPIITPKVLTDQEKQQQKEDAMKKGAIVEAVKDPYANSSVLNKLVTDVEAFGKFVDDLSISILGVSRLDNVWKSLIDSQDHDVKKQSIAIARCYPMKNRDPDIMPYDETRVVLTTTKDDYINASWINDLAPSCPKFVATQAPLTVTMTDFWAMVYELGSEVIVQITSEYETGKKFPVYFPTEKGQQLEQGPMILNLQTVKYRQLWTERNIYLKHSQTKQGRTVIHLQFKTWPVSGFPEDVHHILRFISEVHSFYQQQRSLLKPVIVHCGNGVGRTGSFLMIYTGMQEMLHGNGLTDVPALAKRMLQRRKNLIHKKEQLKFCYDALLCFAEDFLKKRNILVKNPHFEKKTKTSEPAPATSAADDIVLGSVNLHTLQQTVGRLHVHTEGDKSTTLLPDPQSQVVQQCKEPQPVSSLPDLIQQPSRSEGGSGSGSGLNHSAGEERAEFTKAHSRSGSNASQQSLISTAESGSSRSSPQHGSSFSHSPSPSAGAVAQSLADLQDPTKFTLGKGEQKKRFTKASFERKGSGSGLEVKVDPSDPLSSLDAMWSIHKPGQSDK